MRGFKALLLAAAMLVGLAAIPAAQAQIMISIGVPPTCRYGYYENPPYRCAPYGYYGPGYFYNGIFLGVGPWAGWGYAHGWGSHRFIAAGGGHYNGRGGYLANHSHYASGGHPVAHGAPQHSNAPHTMAHGNASHESHQSSSHGSAHTESHGSSSHGGDHDHK